MCSIHVTDPARAHTFYTEILGFDTMISMPEHNVYVINGKGQDTGLLLEPSDNPIAFAYMTGLRKEGFPVIVVSTDDIDADIARLKAEGVRFIGDKFGDQSGQSINLDDTVGNIIQLHQAA